MKVIVSLPPIRRPFETITTRMQAGLWQTVLLLCQRAVAMLREWRRRSRDREQLARFDERMLRDIGITRGELLAEINKPFWRR